MHTPPLRLLVFALLLLWALLLQMPPTLLSAREHLGDFGSFVLAARHLARGENPYASGLVYAPGLSGERQYYSSNANPPVSLLLFWPLAHLLDPLAVRRVWLACSLAAYVAIVLVLTRRTPRGLRPLVWAWCAAWAGLWQTLERGQVYILPLLVCVTAAWLLLPAAGHRDEARQGHPGLAGLLLAPAIALKPNLALAVLVLLVAGWSRPPARRTALVALVGAAVLSLLPLIVWGWEPYARWLAAVAPNARSGTSGNMSLPGLAVRVGVRLLGLSATTGPAILVPAATAAVSILTLAWAWRTRPAAHRGLGVGLVASLLAAPLAWVGYTVLLLPAWLSLPAGRSWPWPRRVAAALLLLPDTLVWLGADAPLVPLLLWGFVRPLALALAAVADGARLGRATCACTHASGLPASPSATPAQRASWLP